MYVGRDFDPTDATNLAVENEVYTLDFKNDLVTGETISSAAWTCFVVTGTDPTPAARLSGAATVSGSMTSQRFTGFLPGVKYRLLAAVLTNLGNTKSLWSHVAARAPD